MFEQDVAGEYVRTTGNHGLLSLSHNQASSRRSEPTRTRRRSSSSKLSTRRARRSRARTSK